MIGSIIELHKRNTIDFMTKSGEKERKREREKEIFV